MSLPRFMVLKSNANNKFLCYGKEKGATHAFLRFSQELKHQQKCAEFPKSEAKDEEEPLATEKIEFNLLKFEVEEAKTAKGFVHIRTCYNNKYWVRKCSTNKIVAEAHEPEEDESKPSCTLFKPIFLGEADDDEDSLFPSPRGLGNRPQKIQLIHVSELGQHYIVDADNDELVEAAEDAAASTPLRTFTAYNVQVTAMLPERLTLMGHDGQYLTAHDTRALGFISTDPGTRGVAMYVSPQTRPQYMPIHVRDDNKSWLLNTESFIAAVATTAPTFFGPIKVDNYIVLHCLANGNFVERSDIPWANSTICRNPTITEAAKLQVGEPVVAREIVSADYDLDDSRIYNTSSVEKFSDSRSNRSSVEQTGTFQVEYKTSQTASWNQSLTVSIGIAVTWTVGFPYVGEFGLEMSYDQTKTSEWGEQVTDEKTVTFTQNVVIPPRKKVTLKVLAMRSMCDVPFTCVVRDVLTNGRTIQYTKTDGVFAGSNEYQFTTHIDEEDA